jgi:predicted secreted protein
MRFYVLFVSLIILSMSVSASVSAQEYDGLKLPPQGTTILHLSATETQKVPQDLLIASLRIEADGTDLVQVQDTVNKAMAAALELARKNTDLKVTTGGYSVYPYDPTPPNPAPQNQNEKLPQRWRAQQTLDIQSLKPDAVLKTAGELQAKGFAMNNLGYTLSPEKYETVQDSLLEKALAKLENKAALAGKALKKEKVEMLDVNLSPSGPVYPMMYARAEMAMDMGAQKTMAAPVVAAGESDVSLSVSARVLLKP